MIKINHPKRKILLAMLVISGPVFLLLTTPTHLALPLLVVPYAWLFLVLYLLIGFVWDRFAVLRRHALKRRLACITGAAVPISLLLLQSIHQLSLRDVVLVLGLSGLSIFYVSRFSLQNEP